LHDAADERQAYEELQAYTLTLGDPTFLHQHVVDAWAAQHADARTKPIAITFALMGLYLHLEHGFTGRAVQLAHMKLGQRRHKWPTFALPRERGAVTAIDVMAAAPGRARASALDAWCASVWAAYAESHRTMAELMVRHGVTGE
jgi:hypothetical protein